ncbi:hypothetical protein C5L32_002115 [Lentilactobacillus buchneri]|uniref:Uncharacterized protein n=1 Tax=Lentilactobacillus buchneri DSM 20057 TaxID=1423728 RepID=A0A4R5NII0_LENBU|nr:hypothetical protein C5L32_002115 [Lentilactobacillus buchneri]
MPQEIFMRLTSRQSNRYQSIFADPILKMLN